MQILKTQLLIVLAGLVSLPALAVIPDPADQNVYHREFKFLDKDKDEKLSASEIKKDELFDDGGFAKADKNRNGSLDLDEYATYKSKIQNEEAKQILSDSAITAKVKSEYLIEKDFKSFDVSVETKDGIVVLSGFVENASTKTRAGIIARGVKGVKSVSNGLVIQP